MPHPTAGPDERTLLERITIDPAICHGKPCIRGLRYPVETMLELLGGGMSIDEILADYPDLERDDLLAVLAYATRLARVKRITAVGNRPRVSFYGMVWLSLTPTIERTILTP